MSGNAEEIHLTLKVLSDDDVESAAVGRPIPDELAFALSELTRGVAPIIVNPTFINCTHSFVSEEPLRRRLRLFVGE